MARGRSGRGTGRGRREIVRRRWSEMMERRKLKVGAVGIVIEDVF